jgi:hypothetical protein
MEKDEGREVASFLSFPGLYDSPGGKEGMPEAACISDIKGQKHYRRETLDYYWNLITKSAERNKSQKEENRIAKYRRSFDYVETKDGDYAVLNKKYRKSVRPKELLKIYEGLVLARTIKKDSAGGEFKTKRGGGKKKKITEFSKSSRLNLMKHLGMMKNRPEFWHDLTYPDDVMEGLSIEERKLKSSEDIHQLKRWMERAGINAHGAWKREWKIRKSGILKGTGVPHFHNVDWLDGADDRKYIQEYYRIAEKWLEITGTQGEYKAKARKVLYHEKSYRFIMSQKQMRKYMQKYISKDEEFISDESIGRNWGLIGDPIEQNPEEATIEHNEMVLLKRMLRKLCKGINKKVKYGLHFCLSHERTQFFVIMEKQTAFRMLEQIRSETIVEGVHIERIGNKKKNLRD